MSVAKQALRCKLNTTPKYSNRANKQSNATVLHVARLVYNSSLVERGGKPIHGGLDRSEHIDIQIWRHPSEIEATAINFKLEKKQSCNIAMREVLTDGRERKQFAVDQVFDSRLPTGSQAHACIVWDSAWAQNSVKRDSMQTCRREHVWYSICSFVTAKQSAIRAWQAVLAEAYFFKQFGRDLVQQSLKGYNVCIFAYGHTGLVSSTYERGTFAQNHTKSLLRGFPDFRGSGKTFTMLGDGLSLHHDIVPTNADGIAQLVTIGNGS
eukprot:4636692-Amphidinium_carterae.2